jgi:hypothetical protein
VAVERRSQAALCTADSLLGGSGGRFVVLVRDRTCLDDANISLVAYRDLFFQAKQLIFCARAKLAGPILMLGGGGRGRAVANGVKIGRKPKLRLGA